MATKKAKNAYLKGFGITVLVLALVRCASDADWSTVFAGDEAAKETLAEAVQPEQVEQPSPSTEADMLPTASDTLPTTSAATELSASDTLPTAPTTSTRYVPDGGTYHRILSVSSYHECFPDSNDVQLEAARRWGVSPVQNREDAEKRKSELVYMAASPYYRVAPLNASIPYLVPRAAVLLQDIGQAFFDSPQVKGLPLHHLVVSSVLRSEDDVRRLRRTNKNATEQSCHLYGTTFDINYNSYFSVADPDTSRVGSDKLKFVLSEVLDDLRRQGRCYIKYEVKQPCFHITVR